MVYLKILQYVLQHYFTDFHFFMIKLAKALPIAEMISI